MKPKRIVVSDKMQKRYVYERTERPGKGFDPAFTPDLTPKQMLEMGVFGGKYMTDCKSEFPSDWFTHAKLATDKKDPALNYFKVDASTSLEVWDKSGWLHPDDPRGWFQWYCRYYMGRRHEDDPRQIGRWRAMSRHVAQIDKHCEIGDMSCRPRQRQALLHWAYDSRKMGHRASHNRSFNLHKTLNQQKVPDMATKKTGGAEAAPLKRPRKPEFEGVETTPWADVPKTFEHFHKCYYKRHDWKLPKNLPEHFKDCDKVIREWISNHSMLGNPKSSTFKTGLVLPVVNPQTGKLNAGGIRAAMVFVSRVNGISDATVKETMKLLKSLYKDYFPKEKDSKLRETDVPKPTFSAFR